MAPLLEFLGREHPAFVHLPLGLVAVLPVALLISLSSRHSTLLWQKTATFLALMALAGALPSLASGLLRARQLAWIPTGGFLPNPSPGQPQLQILQRHELAALAGTLIGLVCLYLLWWSLRRPDGRWPALAALGASLIWAGTWALAGRAGGSLVRGDEASVRAAAAVEAARKADAEAELPLRALDYGSLEPLQKAPYRSAAHGHRWVRTWITASAIDGFRPGGPLPIGAYAVASSAEDDRGRPGADPGPLYFRESLADGSSYFSFYWPRVPESQRGETGGEEYVYWRSPDPRLEACVRCHAGQGSP